MAEKKVKKGSPKARKWVFDIFFMTKTKEGKDSTTPIVTIDWSKVYEEKKDLIRYICVQKERSETNNRLHWQGYIQLFDQCRRRKLRWILDSSKIKHFCEPAKGSTLENQNYCTKLKTAQNEYYEFGKPCTQGMRSEMEICRNILNTGGSMEDISRECFGSYIRYRHSFVKHKEMIDEKTRRKRRVVNTTLIMGPSDCGKTTKIMDKHGDENVYIMNFENNHEWWDGYRGEEVILIDEYNNNLAITRLLRILDKWACRLPIKGGHTYANFKQIYITTNLHRHQIHSNAKEEHIKALFTTKRISKIIDLHPKIDFEIMSRSDIGNTGAISTYTKKSKRPLWDTWNLETGVFDDSL